MDSSNFNSKYGAANNQQKEMAAPDIKGLKAQYADDVEVAVKKGLPTVDRSTLNANYIYDLHGYIDEVIQKIEKRDDNLVDLIASVFSKLPNLVKPLQFAENEEDKRLK